jgi:hypothetical protein
MLIHLQNFAGLMPKLSARALPPNNATVAQNTQLYSGEVRGLRAPLAVANLSAEVFTVKRAYRLDDGSTSIADNVGDWIAFDDPDVNFIRGAIKNDTLDRYYAAGGTQAPVVQASAQWALGTIPYDLGVPAPTNAIVVAAPPSAEVDETRAYVYTFVNIWGEESGPSPVSNVATGDITGTWALSNMNNVFGGTPSNPVPLDKIRIYRTVTGRTSVDYRFVTEITPAATYNDNGDGTTDAFGYETDADSVSLNESIPTLVNSLPPPDLQGIVNMPNGIMVGFVGRDLYFSEAYRPYSWPENYIRSVESPIVGIGVYQQGAVVCTTSNPYVCQGISPDTIILSKIDDVEPCQNFRSIINSLDGVIYSSQNGMIHVSQAGANNITHPLVTRNEWRASYKPETAQCATDGTRIVSFYNANSGWIFTPHEPLGHLVDLNNFIDVTSVQADPFTGEAYYISEDVVYLWNPETTTPLNYTWKSKVFELPYPVNMGAYRIQYQDIINTGDYVPAYDYTTYNTSRFSASSVPLSDTNRTDFTGSPSFSTNPLNTLGLYPLNGVRVETGVADSPPVVQFRMPLGGSPLYGDIAVVRDRIGIKIYADDVLRYDREITSQDVMRLPSGYKADKWQIEFTTAQNIYSFKLAGTAKELVKA